MTRTLAVAFDAAAMAVVAYIETGGHFGDSIGDLVLWGAAIAAAVCAFIVALDGSAFVAWIAVGYVLFGALLTRDSPHLLLVALAVALMPLVPRPRRSLALGLGVAALTAAVTRFAMATLL